MKATSQIPVKQGLKIKDLIKKLSELDPELPIMISGGVFGEAGYFVDSIDPKTKKVLVRNFRTPVTTDAVIEEYYNTYPYSKLTLTKVVYLGITYRP